MIWFAEILGGLEVNDLCPLDEETDFSLYDTNVMRHVRNPSHLNNFCFLKRRDRVDDKKVTATDKAPI